jgi:hypothetical protein
MKKTLWTTHYGKQTAGRVSRILGNGFAESKQSANRVGIEQTSKGLFAKFLRRARGKVFAECRIHVLGKKE